MRETLGAWVLGALFLCLLHACTVKEDCNDCTVKLDVPIPDCVVYSGNGEIRLCPDAGDAGDDGAGE